VRVEVFGDSGPSVRHVTCYIIRTLNCVSNIMDYAVLPLSDEQEHDFLFGHIRDNN
jgi:hypothetical protein